MIIKVKTLVFCENFMNTETFTLWQEACFLMTLFVIPLHFDTQVIKLNEPRHEKTNVLVSDLVRHKPGCTAK